MDVIKFLESLLTTSGLSILLHNIISLSDVTSYDKVDSNTDRLYSQWLNPVIYWLINHSTDWRNIIRWPV